MMATVRAEFRDEVLVFSADDPIFGAGTCLVPGCDRSATGGYGLCQGHHLRWKAAGRPDVDCFAASTDPRWHRQQPNMGLPGRGVSIRFLARGDVHDACAAVATCRASRPGRLARERAASHAA